MSKYDVDMDKEVVAIVEESPYTGEWRRPTYCYTLESAKGEMYERLRAVPSRPCRIRPVNGATFAPIWKVG